MFITKSNTSVTCVTNNTPARELCTSIKSLLMKTRNIHALCVVIKLQGREVLHNINSQSMKV